MEHVVSVTGMPAERTVLADIGIDLKVVYALIKSLVIASVLLIREEACSLLCRVVRRSGKSFYEDIAGHGSAGIALYDDIAGDAVFIDEIFHDIRVINDKIIMRLHFSKAKARCGTVLNVHNDSSAVLPCPGIGVIKEAAAFIVRAILILPVRNALTLEIDDYAIRGIIILGHIVVTSDILVGSSVRDVCSGAGDLKIIQVLEAIRTSHLIIGGHPQAVRVILAKIGCQTLAVSEILFTGKTKLQFKGLAHLITLTGRICLIFIGILFAVVKDTIDIAVPRAGAVDAESIA